MTDYIGGRGTGKKTNVTGVIISKLQDGKVVETWSLWGQLSMMQQIGVLPMPDTAAKQPAFAGARGWRRAASWRERTATALSRPRRN